MKTYFKPLKEKNIMLWMWKINLALIFKLDFFACKIIFALTSPDRSLNLLYGQIPLIEFSLKILNILQKKFFSYFPESFFQFSKWELKISGLLWKE